MKMRAYSIDDLHSAATAELGDDSPAAALLHDVYRDFLDQYVEWFRALREMKVAPE
jgi:hypothetical protein